MIIYKIENKINGKIYIGQTKNKVSDRIASHITNNWPIGQALRKYGLQSFVITIIDYADTKEILDEKEVYWIKFLDCKIPKGYNVADGGSGASGYSHTEEHKKLLSERITGSGNPMNNPETVKKVRLKNLGRKQSEITKKKRSDTLSGKPKSIEHVQRISDSLKGHEVSEEVRKKISEGHKGKHLSEETKQKIALTLTGKPHVSEEAKKKLSLLRKGIPRSEETKAKMRKPKSPEGRAAIALSNKLRHNKSTKGEKI